MAGHRKPQCNDLTDNKRQRKRLTGTKNGAGVWQRIISEIPPHRVRVEAFWGRGSITRRMRPADIMIGVDLDDDAIEDGRDVALMWKSDALEWLANYFGQRYRTAARGATFGGAAWSEHFVYLDPPYLAAKRNYYKVDFTEEDHARLLALFDDLPCPAAISGYRCDLYERLCGFRAIDIPTTNRRGHKVTETLWMNYPEPAKLHDPRFWGAGRRERERVRRRVKNWGDGLANMTPIERQFVFETMAERYRDAESGDQSG